MRIAVLLAGAAFAAAPLAAQTAAPVDERTRDVSGCYDLTVGRWTIGDEFTTSPEHKPPSRFRLDTVPPPHFPVEYHRVAPSSGDTQLNTDSWRWIDSARMIIRWSANTTAGVQLDLRVDGDSLYGTAAEFGDQFVMGRQFPATRAVARRAVCRPPLAPSPATAAASARPGSLPAYRRP